MPAVGVGWDCPDIFLSPLSPALWKTALYRLKYCLIGPLNPKQPTFLILVSVSIGLGKLTRPDLV